MENHDGYISSNRRFFLEAIALVVAAAICAIVANAVAAKSRKVDLIAASEPLPPRQAARSVQPSPELPAPLDPSAEILSTIPSGTAAAAATVPETSRKSTIVTPPTQVGMDAAVRLTSSPSTRTFPPHPDKAWIEIDSADAKLLFDRGAPFFDARRSEVFAQGHIRGAANISVWESDLDEKIRQVYERNIDPAQPVVVYCAGGACEDSHLLSERLWGIGLNAVYVYKDGYPDWTRNGWPTNE